MWSSLRTSPWIKTYIVYRRRWLIFNKCHFDWHPCELSGETDKWILLNLELCGGFNQDRDKIAHTVYNQCRKKKNMGVSSFSAIFLSPKIRCLDCQFFWGCESHRSGLVNNVTDLSYGPIYSRTNYCYSEFQQDHLRMNKAPVIKQSSEVYGSF